MISGMVSPFMRSAVTKEPICAFVAPPDMMQSIASTASASVKSSPVDDLEDIWL